MTDWLKTEMIVKKRYSKRIQYEFHVAKSINEIEARSPFLRKGESGF
jgi:hypothetical protein